MRSFDAVVVGAGPAGLSAAVELAQQGSCLLLEQGPPAAGRHRDDPGQVLSGVGGAGLYSDGKHSFFPSATALWRLPDRAALASAYEATSALLRVYGVEAGQLPEPAGPAPAAWGTWRPKLYPSLYVSYEQRLACIEALWTASGERWSGARVVAAGRAGAEAVLEVERGGRREAVRTGARVVATGRWSPPAARSWLEPLGVRFAFQRVEFGVRLEGPAGAPLFAALPGVDGKLILSGPGGQEARTFCTCREGEVVLGEAEGLRGYSGRADGPRTGRSSVGLLVRTRDPQLGAEVARAFAHAEPAAFPLSAWPGPLPAQFGAAGARALTEALERLLAYAPGLPEATVYAPCIEGVGDYPADDGSLQAGPGVWVAGDAIGRFRGIVASMVSGRYAARRISGARR